MSESVQEAPHRRNGAVKRVRALCASMPGASRKEFLEVCEREGIAYNTAKTQRQRWLAEQRKHGGVRT